jgi:hypothetical protein
MKTVKVEELKVGAIFTCPTGNVKYTKTTEPKQFNISYGDKTFYCLAIKADKKNASTVLFKIGYEVKEL